MPFDALIEDYAKRSEDYDAANFHAAPTIQTVSNLLREEHFSLIWGVNFRKLLGFGPLHFHLPSKKGTFFLSLHSHWGTVTRA